MGNVRILYADWYSGILRTASGGVHLARQYDHLSTMVVFENAPVLDNYYLIVKMKETADGEVKTMEPIELSGSFWLIPNVYTQVAQDITFQVCCKTETGDFESHSAWFKSIIMPSMGHEGKSLDVDPSVMYDPYKKWVEELAMASGAIIIDSELSDTSTNPVQNKVVKAAVDAIDESIGDINGRLDDLENAAIETDDTLTQSGAAADALAVGNALAGLSFSLTVDDNGNATLTRSDLVATSEVSY